MYFLFFFQFVLNIFLSKFLKCLFKIYRPWSQCLHQYNDHYHQKWAHLCFLKNFIQEEWFINTLTWIYCNNFAYINGIWKFSVKKKLVFFHIRIYIIFILIKLIIRFNKITSESSSKSLSGGFQPYELVLWDHLVWLSQLMKLT